MITAQQPISILNTVQHAEALEVGRQRQLFAVNEGLKHTQNLANDDAFDFERHKHAACGEKSVHLFFPCLPWHKNIGILGQPDIGDFIDVKAPLQLPARPYRHLLGGDDEIHNDWVYVLALAVGGRTDRFKIMGWVWGKQLIAAPTRQFQAGRPKMHFLEPTIPPLHPIRTLQEFVGITPALTLEEVQNELRRCHASGPANTPAEIARRQSLWRKLDELLDAAGLIKKQWAKK